MDEVTKKGGATSPLLAKKGGCAIKKISRSHSDSRRRSGCPNRRSFEQPARRFAPPLLARAICE